MRSTVPIVIPIIIYYLRNHSEYLNKLVNIDVFKKDDSEKTNFYINKRFYKLLITESNDYAKFEEYMVCAFLKKCQ